MTTGAGPGVGGTGKTHLAIAIARALAIVLGPMADNGSLRNGSRGRFFNVVVVGEPAGDKTGCQ